MENNSSAQKDPMEMLNALAANPEALRSIMSAFSAAQGVSMQSAQSNVPQSQNSVPSATPPLPDFSAMLSDPETMAKISGVMSMLRSSGASTPSASSAPQSTASPDKSAALLMAIKPYLSGDRQDAIDSLIRFSKFGEILKNM